MIERKAMKFSASRWLDLLSNIWLLMDGMTTSKQVRYFAFDKMSRSSSFPLTGLTHPQIE